MRSHGSDFMELPDPREDKEGMVGVSFDFDMGQRRGEFQEGLPASVDITKVEDDSRADILPLLSKDEADSLESAIWLIAKKGVA